MKKPIKKANRSPVEVLLPCMDYLHGIVAGDEYEAACEYEYARESEILREAARLHKASKDPEKENEENYIVVMQKFACDEWFIRLPWGFIWECPSFPSASWNELKTGERADILCCYRTQGTRKTLLMHEVWKLGKILDEFKAMAAAVLADRKQIFDSKPPQKVYPVYEGWLAKRNEKSPFVHALFSINFTKTKKTLRQEFENWLDLPENLARFKAHENDPTGKTGLFRDRLKDLSAWRIQRELGWKKADRFVLKNRLKDKFGNPRAFLGEWKPLGDDGKPGELNKSPLYGHESGWSKSQRRAEEYLADLIPWEFRKLKKAKKIFKSSS